MVQEEERSRIRTIQTDYLRGLPSIKRMDKILNARIAWSDDGGG